MASDGDTVCEQLLVRGLPALKLNSGDLLILSAFKQCVIRTDEVALRNNPAMLDPFVGTIGNLNAELAFPQVTLTATTNCNLSCAYCYANAGMSPGQVMPLDLVEDVIDLLVTPRATQIKVALSGGEPTLVPEIFRTVLAKVTERGLRGQFVFNTNGIVPERLLDELIIAGACFHLSLDGPSHVHDQLRPMQTGKPSFALVLKTIRRLVAADALLVVRGTVTSLNVHHLAEYVTFCANLGVRHIRLERMNPWGRGVELQSLVPDPMAYTLNYDLASQVAAQHGVLLVNGLLLNLFSPSIQMCPTMAGREIIVLPDGRITGCYAVYCESDPLAELMLVGRWRPLSRTFEFDTERLKRMRSHSVNTIPSCVGCFAKHVCAGGCPAAHFTDTHVPDPTVISATWCRMYRTTLQQTILRLWQTGSL